MINNNSQPNINNFFISSEDIDNNKDTFEISLNCINCFCPFFFQLILIILLIIQFEILLINGSKYWLISIFLFLIFLLILCYYNPIKRKILLTKNVNTGELILNTIGFMNCCCKSKNIILDIENINFYVQNYNSTNYNYNDDKGIECKCDCFLLIMNHFKNNKEIDLDLTNIQKIPVKTFYYFRINNEYENGDLQDQLNKFINISGYYNGFVYKIKFSDYFYTYYFFNPLLEKNEVLYIFIVFYHILMFLIFIFYSTGFRRRSNFNNITNMFLIIFFSIYFIFLILIISCYNYFRERRLRIDFIYSNNFERIFIGIVKYNFKSYLKTFMYDIKSIDKCVFQIQKNEYQKDEYYILRIIFNDGKFEDITEFKGNQQDLEEIILFLNNKLNDKKTKNNDLLCNTPSLM